MSIRATLFSDPACPWAYCENPALRVIEWRYGDQLDWRLVMVGLSEDTAGYEQRGYTPARGAKGQIGFRDRYGMPFAATPKSRLAPSSRACRAVVAARLQSPGREWATFRTLQLANFNTPLLFDDDVQMLEVLAGVGGIDAVEVLTAIDSPEVLAAYAREKERTRSAAGSPTELQGKAANTDGVVRYTAPSVVFETEDGRRLEAGGFQPVEAYDALVVNLDPTLDRHAPPADPAPLLELFELGLTTQEIAACMAGGNDVPDRQAAERALVQLVFEGRAERHPLGGDAVWTAPGGPPPPAFSAFATAAAA